VTVSAEEWAVVETELGSALPNDYKALLAAYPGSTRFFGWYDFLRPEVRKAVAEELDQLRQLRDDIDGQELYFAERTGKPTADVRSPIPFPLHPEEDGLFPWGSAADGVSFYWLRAGLPSQWDVVASYKWVEEFYHLSGLTVAQ
jgi:hypothetical protein